MPNLAGQQLTPDQLSQLNTPDPGLGNVNPANYINYGGSPGAQARYLGNLEFNTLGRQGPQLGQNDASGIGAARGTQMGAIQAQQGLLAGPSLAQLRGQTQFGQSQAAMMSNRNPLAMRQAISQGGQQLGAQAGQVGNAVGQEQMQGQQSLASQLGNLGQGDIASQQGLEQLRQAQQGIDLSQRGQNLGLAQSYEQNYYNVQKAYEQQAQAQWAAELAKQQGQAQTNTQWLGAGTQAVGSAFAAGA